jgi:hypothetical protein
MTCLKCSYKSTLKLQIVVDLFFFWRVRLVSSEAPADGTTAKT